MLIGIPKETFPGERRVAMVPTAVATLAKKGIEVLIETSAGEPAGYSDAAYREKGAKIADSRQQVFDQADAVFQIRSLGANPDAGQADLRAVAFSADRRCSSR